MADPEARALQPRPEVISTAELDLAVDDVAAAAESVVRAAEDAGGFQSGGSLLLDAPASGSVVVRVPAAAFRPTLAAIAALGDLAEQRVDSQDVTDQVADLESRLANARASVDRLRGLLATALDWPAPDPATTSRASSTGSTASGPRSSTSSNRPSSSSGS